MKTFPRTSLNAQPAQRHVQHTVLDGQLVPWDGPTMQVFSPTIGENSEGLKRVCLGSIPRMDAAASLKALDAAEKAFQQIGRAHV